MAIMNTNNPPARGSGYKMTRQGVVLREAQSSRDAMKTVLSPRQVRKQVRAERRALKQSLTTTVSKGHDLPEHIGVDMGSADGDLTHVAVYNHRNG